MKRLDPLPVEVEGRSFATADEARAWLDAKRSVLVAAVQIAPHPFASQLADLLRGYLISGGYRSEMDTALTAGLASAHAAGDVVREVAMLNGFGQLHWLRGAYAEALKSYGVAAELVTTDHMRATLLNNTGLLKRDMGDLTGAVADLEDARRMSAEHPDLHVTVLANLADIAARTGDREQARTLALRSIEEARKVEDGRVEVEALILLGDLQAAIELADTVDYPVGRRRAQLELARHDRALAEELVRDVRASDDLLLESQALLVLAEATGDAAVAREALDLARSREQSAVVARAEAFLAQPPAASSAR